MTAPQINTIKDHFSKLNWNGLDIAWITSVESDLNKNANTFISENIDTIAGKIRTENFDSILEIWGLNENKEQVNHNIITYLQGMYPKIIPFMTLKKAVYKFIICKRLMAVYSILQTKDTGVMAITKKIAEELFEKLWMTNKDIRSKDMVIYIEKTSQYNYPFPLHFIELKNRDCLIKTIVDGIQDGLESPDINKNIIACIADKMRREYISMMIKGDDLEDNEGSEFNFELSEDLWWGENYDSNVTWDMAGMSHWWIKKPAKEEKAEDKSKNEETKPVVKEETEPVEEEESVAEEPVEEEEPVAEEPVEEEEPVAEEPVEEEQSVAEEPVEEEPVEQVEEPVEQVEEPVEQEPEVDIESQSGGSIIINLNKFRDILT
jgi:hypothetical protein